MHKKINMNNAATVAAKVFLSYVCMHQTGAIPMKLRYDSSKI
jgi:hypothetical protein